LWCGALGRSRSNKRDKQVVQGRHINVEDTVLVEKWQLGDARAAEQLIGKYQGRIYNLILKICANPDDAAELMQDTFVKILESINGFERRSAFYTWAFRIAVNLTLNHRKRKATVGFLSLDAPVAADDEESKRTLAAVLLDDKTPRPTQLAENRELCELAQKALGMLDDEHRTVIVLRDIEDMSYTQIADVLAVELGTVKSRLSRARAALRQILEAFCDEV